MINTIMRIDEVINPNRIELYRVLGDILPKDIDLTFQSDFKWKLGAGTYYSTSEKAYMGYAGAGGYKFTIGMKCIGMFDNILELSDRDLKGMRNVSAFRTNSVIVTKRGEQKLGLRAGTTLLVGQLDIPKEYDAVHYIEINELKVMKGNESKVKCVEFLIYIHVWLKDFAHELAEKLDGSIKFFESPHVPGTAAGRWQIKVSKDKFELASKFLSNIPDPQDFKPK